MRNFVDMKKAGCDNVYNQKQERQQKLRKEDHYEKREKNLGGYAFRRDAVFAGSLLIRKR